MKEYKLIALDMDGTLLNDEHQISKGNQEAIAKAIAQGKIVILNTGRCLVELTEFFDVVPGVQYLNSISGACVYDRKNDQKIFCQSLDEQVIDDLFDIGLKEDCVIHLISDQSYFQKDKIDLMHMYNMGHHIPMYHRVTTKVDDIYDFYQNHKIKLEKFNMYFRNKEAREVVKQKIIDAALDVEIAFAEEASLEISAKGVHKGTGIKELCQHLNISLDEVIVVGDGDNDIEALKMAGLAVAMDNAKAHIKELCDHVVADNNHDGCAEAIRQYLLQ